MFPPMRTLALVTHIFQKYRFTFKRDFSKMSVYFKREHKLERGRERIPSRLPAVSAESNAGLDLMNSRDHDLSQNQKSNAQPTEPPRPPHLKKYSGGRSQDGGTALKFFVCLMSMKYSQNNTKLSCTPRKLI